MFVLYCHIFLLRREQTRHHHNSVSDPDSSQFDTSPDLSEQPRCFSSCLLVISRLSSPSAVALLTRFDALTLEETELSLDFCWAPNLVLSFKQWFCSCTVWGIYCIDVGWFTSSIIVVACRVTSSSGSISGFMELLNRALHLIDSRSARLRHCQYVIDFISFCAQGRTVTIQPVASTHNTHTHRWGFFAADRLVTYVFLWVTSLNVAPGKPQSSRSSVEPERELH